MASSEPPIRWHRCTRTKWALARGWNHGSLIMAGEWDHASVSVRARACPRPRGLCPPNPARAPWSSTPWRFYHSGLTTSVGLSSPAGRGRPWQEGCLFIQHEGGRKTVPGGTGMEDHPCTVMHKQFKKSSLYIIDIICFFFLENTLACKTINSQRTIVHIGDNWKLKVFTTSIFIVIFWNIYWKCRIIVLTLQGYKFMDKWTLR
jgi:hypothetical protein